MVLSFFLIISGIVSEEFWSVRQAEILSNKIYLKEQAYVQAVSAFESYLKFFKNDGTSYDTLKLFILVKAFSWFVYVTELCLASSVCLPLFFVNFFFDMLFFVIV